MGGGPYAETEPARNLQELLTLRLQNVAFLLQKLLSHKCVLNDEKKKLAKSILEQSLALPVGLKLDESVAPEELTVNGSISQSLRLDDLTVMFGHHIIYNENKNCSRKTLKCYSHADVLSESDCWSEPDRNVSLARVGLCDTGIDARQSVFDNNRYRSQRSKESYDSPFENIKSTNDSHLFEEIDDLNKHIEPLEEDKNDLIRKLEFAVSQIKNLITEKDELKSVISAERLRFSESEKSIEVLKKKILTLEAKIKEAECQLSEVVQVTEKIRIERQELESMFMETERYLRRAADEATVQASQAALERVRAQYDRLRIEKELEAARNKLNTALDTNAELKIKINRKAAQEAKSKMLILKEVLPSEKDRPTSPDQEIYIDRLSSLEQNDLVVLSPRSLFEENIFLKEKLARTKSILADTLAQLKAANMRKRTVQRAICREIQKAQGVLRKARDQMDHQTSNN